MLAKARQRPNTGSNPVGATIWFLLLFNASCLRNNENFLKHATMFPPRAEHLQGSRFVKVDGRFQLGRLNPRVHLRRFDPRIPEEGPHLLEVVMLPVDLHRNAVTEIVRLELRMADQPAVGLAQTPDVLPLIGVRALP